MPDDHLHPAACDPTTVGRIAFASLKGMKLALARQLLARIPDESTFFNASATQLSALLGFSTKLLDSDLRASALSRAKEELRFTTSSGIRPIYFTDPAFPHRLDSCDDAPVLLYALGNCDINCQRSIAIVGTRHATPYGIGFVDRLVADIADILPGTLIVSGLAYGIDIAAHKAALRHGLPTAAVLAHGLSTIYPSSHRSVAAEIAHTGGVLLTDYPHDAPVHRGNFLARNRIIAALADCTIVVESAEKGGALVTAGIAQSYDRDVFALPGRTSDPYSKGCNRLIATNGAALIQSADDLISAMRWAQEKSSSGIQKELFNVYTEKEQKVIDYLTANGEAWINNLAVALNTPMHKLMALLVDMEFKGYIANYPGGRYRLA
ncbi:MAG: DNA-processing protein DprA [Muribaculaceae bacterium]|nr:DNA-processing protein DprA [Muribaculaceae bacterium]